MKSKLFLLFALLFLLVAPARAQNTLVSGTIKDVTGQAFSGGTYRFDFYPSPLNPSGPYFQNGSPFNLHASVSGNLDSTGSLTNVSVPDNSTITPSGSSWTVTLCPAATSACFSTILTISGASQSISSLVPPAITVNLNNPPPGGVSAYSDSEIVGAKLGSQYFNITASTVHVCTSFSVSCTWAAVGSGGGQPLASYTFSVSGGTVTATPNVTGGTTYSGTDAAVVINDVLGAMVDTGGTLYFKNGTYNLNSATQETVTPYTLFYCVGIPATNTSGLYPNFNFVGESNNTGQNVGIYSAVPQSTGVVFNVTSAAITAAGSSQLAAVWMRPSTATTGVGGSLYWNDQITTRGISVQFPNNQRGNEVAMDFLEASYATAIDENFGFAAVPTAVAAAGDTGFISPATPSNGAYLRNVFAEYWDVGFEFDTEHTHAENLYAFEDTIGIYYARNKNRNNFNIAHPSEFIHPELYDDVTGIEVGTDVTAGSLLNVYGLDLEYITTGPWAYVSGFKEVTPGLTTGTITWSNVLTNVGRGTLTTPFPPGTDSSGEDYSVILNGVFQARGYTPAVIGSTVNVATPTSVSAWRAIGDDNFEGYLNTTPTEAYSIGFNVPGAAPGNNPQFSYYNGTAWAAAWYVNSTNGVLTSLIGTSSPTYDTATNCSSSASPAVCGSAAAGSVTVAAATTSEVVDSTAVTANSQIILTFDSSLGTKLGVTCNTTFDQAYVTARTAGTSFTITASAPTTNPACYSYEIIN